MSEKSRIRDHKIELYARTLLEAAKTEGREKQDLRLLDHLRNMNPEVAELLKVILAQGDEDLLKDIALRYAEYFDAETDIVAVDITSAIELDDALREEIMESLKRIYHKEIYLVEHVKPEIKGGLIFSARGKRMDASIRTQLETAQLDLKLDKRAKEDGQEQEELSLHQAQS